MTVMRCAALVATVSLALVTGCGDDSSGGGSGGNAGSSGSGGGSGIDACAVVTQQDATALFGETATQGDGKSGHPASIGECEWEWENADAHSHLLQFYVWDGAEYYTEPPDFQPLAVGEKGYIRVVSSSIDMGWVQDGKTIGLNYSTFGSSVTPASTKETEMKALAQKASSALP